MDVLLDLHGKLNGFVWGPIMLALLVGTGVYLTLRTNFFSVLRIGYVLKNTLFKMFDKEVKGEGEITPFQAVATALAATVGTGNVAGVATAIALGGPGAIFWMWVSALFGMTTKFAEVVLAVKFRERTDDGRIVGGPMYYLQNGLKSKGLGRFLAVLFSIFGGFAAFGIGNMVQSNSVAAALQETLSIPPLWTGIALAVLTALVVLGGIKRIGAVTEKLVPFMATIYILGALFIIIMNIAQIPAAFGLIFRHAFAPAAPVAGFAGATISVAMRRGISRGVFSNEAGLGSAPIAHAAATTDSPVRQGLWGVFEVFVDTIIICTLTAMAIMVSGLWNSGVSGAALTTQAFEEAITGGGYIVSVGIVLFAFSTILGWEYYGERCAEYLFGKGAIIPYRIIWIPAVIIGSIGGLELLWDVADTLNGLMILPNIIGVILLSGTVIALTKEYFRDLKNN